MKPRLLPTAALALSLPILAGCGDSTASTPGIAGGPPRVVTRARSEPADRLTAEDLAAVQAELDQVDAEERAYQSQNPVGKRR